MKDKRHENRRETTKILNDRAKGFEMYLKGYSKDDIAKELNLSPFQIENDLRSSLATAATATEGIVKDQVFLALAKIEFLEKNAWEAYIQSGEDATIKNNRDVQKIDKTTGELITISRVEVERIESRVPGSSYLNVINAIQKNRAQLLQLLANDRAEFTPEAFVKAQMEWLKNTESGAIDPPEEQESVH